MIKLQKATQARPSLHLKLEGFRAFANSGTFRLAPLTCIVGPNSSGKTSIIAALLLLKQSLEQEVFSTRVSPLALSGPYCDLGSFADAVHGNNTKTQIGFTFTVPFRVLTQPILENPIVNLGLPQTRLSRRFYGPYYRRSDLEPFSGNDEIEMGLFFAVDEPFGPSLSRLEIRIQSEGSARFIRTVGGKRRQHWRSYSTDLPHRSLSLRFHPSIFFPLVHSRSRAYQNAGPHTKRRIKKFVRGSQLCFAYLQEVMGASELIGPFRTPPARMYSFGGFSSTRGGTSGQRTIDLLITEKLLRTPGQPLQEAVSFWLRHLKLAGGSVSIEDVAKGASLFQVNLGRVGPSTESNLADVGYGISQILPVIVQGLLMPPGAIYIVQQPEIHLHPDAQAGLTDFFLFLSSKGVRTIVETHSEYFLIRLRRRLSEGALRFAQAPPRETNSVFPIRVEDVSVLLTSSDRKSGSTVKELEIGPSFQFENLPKGFMDQAVQDRMALLKSAGKGHE